MGTFRIVVTAVGGHGVDREKKDGEVVDFNKGGSLTPESIAGRFIEELVRSGSTISEAKIIHWPETESEVRDNLITGIREGNF